MVLSDMKVKDLLKNGKISIIPEPPADAWQAMTLEGHLAEEIYRIKWKSHGGARIAIDMQDYKTRDFASQFWEKVEPNGEGYVPIHPNEFFLAYTIEKLALPLASKVCALVEGKSGLARIGLGIHLAPIIHCGFGNDKDGPQPIMLEMYNHSKNIILLRPEYPICQFIFQMVDGEFESKGVNSLGGNQPRIKSA